MPQYVFTCPLQGCNVQMTANANDAEEGAKDLTAQAQQHLVAVHPDIHKTSEEVEQDIKAHMVTKA